MKIKYSTIVPLIGGLPLGNSKALNGQKPEYILSYKEFAANDSNIKNYWKDTPFHLIDSNSNKIDTKLESVDFVSSTCPCAGLSTLNSGNRGENAPQNEWMYKTSRFVFENIKPKVFWGENAPALFTKSGKGVREKLIEIGKEYGYTFSIIKTDTRLHGIPQRRIRSFYFFWRDTNPPIFNNIIKEYKPLLEYLNEIPQDATYQDVFIDTGYEENPNLTWFNSKPEYRKEARKVLARSIMDFVMKTKRLDEFINFLEKEKSEKLLEKTLKAKKKMESGGNIWDWTPHILYPDTYMNGIQGKVLQYSTHPIEKRYLNQREVMHLMGLPHDYEVSDSFSMNHVAQNVPVNTAADWTKEVLRYLKGDFIEYSKPYYTFDNTKEISEKIKPLF